MAKIIKAKYPKIGYEYTHSGIQGFGSTYGGNHASVKTQLPTEHYVINISGYKESAFGRAFNDEFK